MMTSAVERVKPMKPVEAKALLTKKQEVRIVLLGKTGVGKSATGNTILGKKAFRSTLSSSSVTEKCEKQRCEFDGQILTVVDTPGLFDTKEAEEEKKREIAKCISFAAPGPHVFLILTQIGRFTKEDLDSVKILQKLFGRDASNYTIVLFTRGDDLHEFETTTDELINNNPHLCKFINQCSGGYHVFNNRSTDPFQVRELLKKINTVVERNGGEHYTSEMFEKAERAIREEMRRLQRENPGMDLGEARAQAERDNEFIQGFLTAAGAAVVGAVAGASGAAVSGAVVGAAAGPAGILAGGATGAAVGLTTAGAAAVAKKCIIQ